jgi:hypothetical protein
MQTTITFPRPGVRVKIKESCSIANWRGHKGCVYSVFSNGRNEIVEVKMDADCLVSFYPESVEIDE